MEKHIFGAPESGRMCIFMHTSGPFHHKTGYFDSMHAICEKRFCYPMLFLVSTIVAIETATLLDHHTLLMMHFWGKIIKNCRNQGSQGQDTVQFEL